jgi:transcriptional regulator with XRE-family HTH domain
MRHSLAGIVDDYKHRSGLSDAAIATKIGMSRMNLNLWRKEIRGLPTHNNLVSVAQVTGTSYRVVLDAALTDCGYLATPPSVDEVSLDGIVAVSRILSGLLGRGLTPSEAARLKTAWQIGSPRTLHSIADALDPQEGIGILSCDDRP